MSRILHILSQTPSVTGSGIFLDNISTLANEAGHVQALVVGLPLSMNAILSDLFTSYEAVFPLYFETDTLPFKLPGMSDVMPYDSSRFSDLSEDQWTLYLEAFRQIIDEAIITFNPDIILSGHLWAATVTALSCVESLTSHKKPKVFGICHGTDLRQMQLTPHKANLIRSKCQNIDAIFCLHNKQIQDIEAVYGIHKAKLILAGNGYNANIFKHSMKRTNRKTTLIYAGKLCYSKGLLELIDALEILNQTYPVHLKLAGRGSGHETQAILQRIETVNAKHNRIELLGFLDQTELAESFAQSDLFVLPSYYEGLPLVILEALATGLPVVVNDLPGLQEWIGDDINKTSAIRYVPMPELKQVDCIQESSRAPYIQNLVTAIENILKAHRIEAPKVDFPFLAIEERSWSKVFNVISHAFKI